MKNLSNVRICVVKRDLKIIKNKLLEIKSNIFNVCDVIEEFTGTDNRRYVVFGWNNIEWYLSYEDVFAIEQILKKFKAKGIPFKFIRVGQDMIGDVEQDAFYDTSYIIGCEKVLQTMLVKL